MGGEVSGKGGQGGRDGASTACGQEPNTSRITSGAINFPGDRRKRKDEFSLTLPPPPAFDSIPMILSKQPTGECKVTFTQISLKTLKNYPFSTEPHRISLCGWNLDLIVFNFKSHNINLIKYKMVLYE